MEWAKGRARHLRWQEEVLLLAEEQRRVLATLQWKADWWDARGSRWEGLDGQVAEGVQAYAQRQRGIQLALHAHFQKLWTAPAGTAIEEEDGENEADRVLAEEARITEH